MSWLHSIWSFLYGNSSWMSWNLFLALIPLWLSQLLFQPKVQLSFLWWVGIVIFAAFLPNAPYIVTDLIHLVQDLQSSESLLFSSLVILPTYLLFVLLGLEAYVLCLINLGQFLQQRSLSYWIVPVELLLHGLCAIGIYLGRIQRFNSWDLAVQPFQIVKTLLTHATTRRSLLFILLTASVTALLYVAFKAITLALLGPHRNGKFLNQSPEEVN